MRLRSLVCHESCSGSVLPSTGDSALPNVAGICLLSKAESFYLDLLIHRICILYWCRSRRWGSRWYVRLATRKPLTHLEKTASNWVCLVFLGFQDTGCQLRIRHLLKLFCIWWWLFLVYKKGRNRIIRGLEDQNLLEGRLLSVPSHDCLLNSTWRGFGLENRSLRPPQKDFEVFSFFLFFPKKLS